jgi:L(+)-tartrate dehydratase alpha subunit
MSRFTSHIGKRLPGDVTERLGALREKEVNFLAKEVYTGVIQYFLTAGARFPYLGDLEEILRNATLIATKEGPLRHNAVETFEEKNTGTNTGSKIPWLDWEIVPDSDSVTIDVYMAGGGCTLPGAAKVLMPGQGYEGVAEFVFDVVTSRGVNACPPLLVGVGVSTSAETAARLSKKAILRPVDSRNPNERAAMMEDLLADGLNELGLGPQGLTGNASVMGVNIESSARHPSTIGVGRITINADLTYEVDSHKEFNA